MTRRYKNYVIESCFSCGWYYDDGIIYSGCGHPRNSRPELTNGNNKIPNTCPLPMLGGGGKAGLGFVYFIYLPELNTDGLHIIKIGRTKNIETRMLQLSKTFMMPQESMDLIICIRAKNDAGLEILLHSIFTADNAFSNPYHGELFFIGRDIIGAMLMLSSDDSQKKQIMNKISSMGLDYLCRPFFEEPGASWIWESYFSIERKYRLSGFGSEYSEHSEKSNWLRHAKYFINFYPKKSDEYSAQSDADKDRQDEFLSGL